MFNGEILSYNISEKPNFKSISEALNKAINIINDCNFRRTFHSDEGWAYQMKFTDGKFFWNNETRNVLW